MSSLIDFAGKRIVITGAYSGIGAALVDLLRKAGADQIVVLDLKEPEASVEDFIPTDMGDPASIDAAIQHITASGSAPVDLLFNNAGIAGTHPADAVMRVNILGLKRLTEGLWSSMQTGGAIVNTASIAGNRWAERLPQIGELLKQKSWDNAVAWVANNPELVVDSYSFSKECLQVYTMHMSTAATEQGIRINSVCPSPVDTPLLPAFRETMTDLVIDWAIESGAGRVATAQDQAQALLFLASDLASYINGVNLIVDGGFGAALQTGQTTPPTT